MVKGIERADALDMVDLAKTLAALDNSWGTETFEVADGQAVLFGPGLYVNRVLAAGIEGDVADDELDLLEERSRVVGVPPAIEVTELTHAPLLSRLMARGYRAENATTSMLRALEGALPELNPSLEVEVVDSGSLADWQAAAVEGWDHTSDEARRASDAFAAAAAESQSPGLLLARSADDGRVLGCASLSIRDRMATLGGMATLPAERGRGVQGALIAYRLRSATEAGCKIAVTQVDPESASHRNLSRFGFQTTHTKVTWAAL